MTQNLMTQIAFSKDFDIFTVQGNPTRGDIQAQLKWAVVALKKHKPVVVAMPMLSGCSNFFYALSGPENFGQLGIYNLSHDTDLHQIGTLLYRNEIVFGKNKRVPGFLTQQTFQEKSITIFESCDRISDPEVWSALLELVRRHVSPNHKFVLLYTTDQKIDQQAEKRADLLAQIVPDLKKRLRECWGVSSTESRYLEEALDKILSEMGSMGKLDDVGRRLMEYDYDGEGEFFPLLEENE